MTLDPGGYTDIVRDVGGSTGIGLFEVFKIGGRGSLGNISTRGIIGTGDELMIGGFIVENS